ncbi:MAG: metalloregulator ArsR/SmtB family transcription factor, partial [Gemmatimonadaceae bacterium]|nr:metalloregulator ArsR/SmtB family transcription factor [Gemmatimonadaceae bacterium]
MPTSQQRFTDTIYAHFARLGKAVSAPKRIELLDLLCQGPRTVEALAQLSAISVANASQHLQVLRAARLVDAEKKGL